MSILLIVLASATPCLCIILFACMVVRLNRVQPAPRLEDIHGILRGEGDRIRQSAEEGARGLRAEVADGLRGQQDSTIKAFRELGDALSAGGHPGPRGVATPDRDQARGRLDEASELCEGPAR